MTFFRFEVRYWLRGCLVWCFLAILTGLIFAGSSSGVWKPLESTHRNAPFLIGFFYSRIGLLTLLMTTAFVTAAATREYTANMHQIVFSAPLRKWPFLLGRWAGAGLIAVIPLLSVSLGNILATWMPWNDPSRWGPTCWEAHFWGIVTFAIPNTLIAAAVLFPIAALTRSGVASFLAGLLLLVAYVVSNSVGARLENQALAALLDPFGVRTFGFATRYWSLAEKNTLAVVPQGLLLWNRLLWMAAGAAVFAIAGARYSFAERAGRKRPVQEPAEREAVEADPLPQALPSSGRAAGLARFRSLVRIEFRGLLQSPVFLVLLAAALMSTLPELLSAGRELLGNTSRPVTYVMVEILRGDLQLFLLVIVGFFAGVMVWKEREAGWDEIQDSTPVSRRLPFAAKFTALLCAVVLIEAVCVLAAIAVQAARGHTRFQPGLYLSEVFFWDLPVTACAAAAAFFCQVVTPNKYAGYFAFLMLAVWNQFGWTGFGVESHLLRFGSRPSYIYSDLYGYGPYLAGLAWFTLYWCLFAALPAAATALLWPRGRETSPARRIREARGEWRGPLRTATAAAAALFLATGAWCYYNTRIRHESVTNGERKNRQAEYERKYKRYAALPRPQARSVRYRVDLYPERGAAAVQGSQVLENASGRPISELHLNTARDFETSIEVERGTLKRDDRRVYYRIYTLSPPLEPGGRLTLRYTVRSEARGFANELPETGVAGNGTFLSNRVAPRLGYLPELELTGHDRRAHGLPEREALPPPQRACGPPCADNGRNSGWVEAEAILCTAPDQTAVAPGRLLREWTENGRRCFHYRLDRPSIDSYAFLSGRYRVARESWKGIRMEVYHHPEHAWNVPAMLHGLRRTLEYGSANFGPYPHREIRIVEFPRAAVFAQALPGTIPYSEGIGFIAARTPGEIDHVLFVTAHEAAHQWWGHQVAPARLQGGALLVETLAQYTALMVMEKEYGQDMMRKVMAYEMDRYLRGRGRDALPEKPLLRADPAQAYVHDDKGSLAMYCLKEAIGEEAVNRALRKVLGRYGFAGPPYPSSYALLDALDSETPGEWKYLLRDLFDDITVYSNRAVEARAVKRPDGKYDVDLEVEVSKFKAGAGGAEQPVPVDDWIEIGALSGSRVYRERVRMKEGRNRFTFTLDRQPERAGVDPLLLLVDRAPEDNLRAPTSGDGAR
ncbi:MAG: ABC transporter permease [Bryobacterales bacterium]|nr:ABC transporter permease [Bryobacterales bacterium]